jgi:hypothetical protein
MSSEVALEMTFSMVGLVLIASLVVQALTSSTAVKEENLKSVLTP